MRSRKQTSKSAPATRCARRDPCGQHSEPKEYWPRLVLEGPLAKLVDQPEFKAPRGYRGPQKASLSRKGSSNKKLLGEGRRERYIKMDLSCHVLSLSEMQRKHACSVINGYRRDRFAVHRLTPMLPSRSLSCSLSYPMSRRARVTVYPYRSGIPFVDGTTGIMTVGWFLWSLARAYRAIYNREDEFGVCCHELGDLYFEGLVILDQEAQVWVGS